MELSAMSEQRAEVIYARSAALSDAIRHHGQALAQASER